ncbi:TPA: hypothetical protein PCF62_002144 [Klebsiella quasipneumoniae]|nr:hypothetical protein [Klebsiella quasipneumoniae]
MVNYDAFYSNDIYQLSKVSDEELNFWVMVVANDWQQEAHPQRMNLTFLGGNIAHWDVDDEVDTIPDYCRDANLNEELAKENCINTRPKHTTGCRPAWISSAEGVAITSYGYAGRSICLAYIAMHMGE